MATVSLRRLWNSSWTGVRCFKLFFFVLWSEAYDVPLPKLKPLYRPQPSFPAAQSLAKSARTDTEMSPFSLDSLCSNQRRRRSFRHAANTSKTDTEVAFKPSRVILQDFTGVPAVVDLAAMRDATKRLGADPAKINPHVPVDLVVDHSVQVRSSPLTALALDDHS